jgi:hypothetical protein
MGFLPFVNQGGRRVVRWPRLVLAWAAIMAAALLGSCAASYLLTGGWRQYDFAGIWLGVLGCASFALYGLTAPVYKLPRVRRTSSSGVRHA